VKRYTAQRAVFQTRISDLRSQRMHSDDRAATLPPLNDTSSESGELELMSEPVDIDELIEEDPQLARRLADIVIGTQTPRNLQ